jgi:hypothetical protein
MSVERYVLPDTPDGLVLALNLTLSLRHNGFKTRLVPTKFGHGDVANTLVAVPPPRLTRREICPLNSR